MNDGTPLRRNAEHGEINKELIGSIYRDVLNVVHRATSTYIATTPPYVRRGACSLCTIGSTVWTPGVVGGGGLNG